MPWVNNGAGEMARYRDGLPQLDGDFFLTDGGLETCLIFHRGLDLPQFAAFDLFKDDRGTDELRRYYAPYARAGARSRPRLHRREPDLAGKPALGGGDRLLGSSELDRINRKAIALMEEVRERYESESTPVVISGCIGPQDDGYNPSAFMSADAAREYHATQIGTFADTEADMVTAITMTYVEEALGLTRAAGDAGMPVAISFTVETDGRLPSGQPLGEAIEQVDAETDAAPAYYMINCAHPAHFEDALAAGGGWRSRIRRPARERLDQEPRRARRGDRARRGRPGRSRQALRTTEAGRSALAERARRLRSSW